MVGLMSFVHFERKSPPTVLVVDDDPDMMDILTHFLSKAGMVVLPAYDGQQCLERVSQEAVDAIVLDVVRSGMDGLEICAALKKMTTACTIPILLLAAQDDLDTRLAAMRLGVSEFILKPARIRDLLDRLRIHIEFNRKAHEMDQALSSLPEAETYYQEVFGLASEQGNGRAMS